MTVGTVESSSRTVIVTGAARGMGEAIVRRLLAEGYDVVAVDRDSRVEHLAALGAHARQADVTDADAAKSIVDEVLASGSGLHGLVNVAGIHRIGTVLTATDDDWNAVMGVNFFGTLTWARAVLPAMVAARQGVIINFASVAASRARPASAAYAASKHAVLGLTRSIALDHGADGVRCNAVSPGSIDTPMFRHAMQASGITLEQQSKAAPLERIGTVEEIAGTVRFLLSDDAAFLNGADTVVDGGRTVQC